MGIVNEPLVIVPLQERDVLTEYWQFLSNLIFNNIQDSNVTRREKTNPLDRDWIFGEYPESNDENYPRAVVKFATTQQSEYAANQYISAVVGDNGDTQKEIYGTVITVPTVIGVFVKRGQRQQVQLADGTVRTLQNAAMADYLAYKIKVLIEKSRDQFIGQRIELLNNPIIQSQNSEGDFIFGRVLTFDVQMLSVYVQNYQPGQLIRNINKIYEFEELS